MSNAQRARQLGPAKTGLLGGVPYDGVLTKAEELQAQASLIALAADGSVTLEATDAECHGIGVGFENARGEGKLGFWDYPEDWISWRIKALSARRYPVRALIAVAHANGE